MTAPQADRLARFKVSGVLIGAAMHMPPDSIIRHIGPTDEYGMFEFVVWHPSIPMADEPQDCLPSVTHSPERYEWSWAIEEGTE